MHPFIYLSLKLDPKNVDVNVHPTKHEVHFLNEEQIVEIITAAVEKKLLGCNNSRVYFTQAKLPIVTSNTIQSSPKEKSEKVYPKELVRTDSSNQKLEKFFGATTKKMETMQITDRNDDDNVDNKVVTNPEDKLFEERNKQFLIDNEKFESKLLNKTIEHSPSPKKKMKTDVGFNPVGGVVLSRTKELEVTTVECELTSVLELRKKIEGNCHPAMRELFNQHVFVGCIDPSQALIQHGTKLYMCNTQQIMEELFYQFVMYNFQNFGIISFSDPLSVKKLALEALKLPETGWTPEDGDKNELAEKVTEILTEKGEMLKEYFTLEIDENGDLKTLPLLLDKHVPEMTGLPMYLLRLATEVNWESELECFETFARETAKYYSFIEENDSDEKHNWKWLVEHVFYPAIKDFFLPPKSFINNAAIVELANLPNLYKVFERC
ncbi:DNA mismatch repair protein Mlh1-like [Agrilus planipennis]|nr:DNA mismatch repair protein Mlh1-like [Agrilus planipennis]